MRFEQDCLTELQQQIQRSMHIGGLIDHSHWQANLRDLITSPVEAMGTGCLFGSLAGIYAGVIAETIAGIGLGVGLGLGAVVCFMVSAALFEDTALARNMGFWNFDDGKERAMQTVLDILNKPDFQAQAKELVQAEFDRRLRSCLEQLADLRDPSASDLPEARQARKLQDRLTELQRALSGWSTLGVSGRSSVCRKSSQQGRKWTRFSSVSWRCA